MTIPGVAAELGIGRTTCWALAARGDLAVVRIGRLVRVRREDLDAFLAARLEGGNGGAPTGGTPVRARRAARASGRSSSAA
ncbi:MAG: helix-turn-helix domain-containing protein [Candidatus Dormibacteria bacterium]